MKISANVTLFMATWCPHSIKMRDTLIKEIGKERVMIINIDSDESADAVTDAQLIAIPTLHFIDTHDHDHYMIGYKGIESLRDWLKERNIKGGI